MWLCRGSLPDYLQAGSSWTQIQMDMKSERECSLGSFYNVQVCPIYAVPFSSGTAFSARQTWAIVSLDSSIPYPLWTDQKCNLCVSVSKARYRKLFATLSVNITICIYSYILYFISYMLYPGLLSCILYLIPISSYIHIYIKYVIFQIKYIHIYLSHVYVCVYI